MISGVGIWIRQWRGGDVKGERQRDPQQSSIVC